MGWDGTGRDGMGQAGLGRASSQTESDGDHGTTTDAGHVTPTREAAP